MSFASAARDSRPRLGIEWLAAMPEQRRPKPAPMATKKRQMTAMERAMHQLRKVMIANRDTSATALRHYVAQRFPEGTTVSVSNMPSKTVNDAVAQVALLHVAAISSIDTDKLRNDGSLRNLGFVIEEGPHGRVDTEFFNLPDFSIRREGRKDAT